MVNDTRDMNAREFSSLLLEMAAYAENTIESVIRKTCIDLYRRIVEWTAVDTGRAKGSWGIEVNREGEHELSDNKDGYSYSQIESVINNQVAGFRTEQIGDSVIIYNNLEYIEELEDGSSDQAPVGMVAVSLAEFESFFNNAIRELAGDIT